MEQSQPLAPAPTAPQSLRDLVGEPGDFFANIWNAFPYQYHAHGASRLLSPAGVWSELDCGLIVRPYVKLSGDSQLTGQDAAWVTRSVVNNELAAYPNVDHFRERYDDGCTITLERPELWRAEVASLVRSLKAGFRGDVWSTAFLGTPRSPGLRLIDESAPAHSFVLQLAGQSSWSTEGSPVSRDRLGAFDASLRAGDVVYLPPECGSAMRFSTDESLLLVISVLEITAKRLAEIMLALFLRTEAAQSAERTQHEMSVDAKVTWLRSAISSHLAKQDPQDALKIALRQRS